MSQAPADNDAAQTERGGTFSTLTADGSDLSIDFAHFPLDATIKYVAQNGLDPRYPPRNVIKDPSVDDAPHAQAHEDESARDKMEEASGFAPRTRSATSSQADRHPSNDNEEIQFFDQEEEHAHLAAIATQHYQSQPPPKEIEVIVNFLHRCHRGGTSIC